jgi:transposase
MGFSMKEIYDLTGTQRKTIYRWQKKYGDNVENVLQRTKRKLIRRSRLLNSKDSDTNYSSNSVLKIIEEYFDKFPGSTQRECKYYLYSSFGISISLRSLSKYLKKIKMAKEEEKQHVVENATYVEELIEKRHQFVEKENLSNLAFLDETFTNGPTKRKRGYAKKDQELQLPSQSRKGEKHNIPTAMNAEEILEYDIEKDS